jgi:hypothetical protein
MKTNNKTAIENFQECMMKIMEQYYREALSNSVKTALKCKKCLSTPASCTVKNSKV